MARRIHRSRFALFFILLSVFLLISQPLGQTGTVRAQDPVLLSKVADLILAWDGQSPGELAGRIKREAPNARVIELLRELNQAYQRRQLRPDLLGRYAEVVAKQNAYQGKVRDAILRGRDRALAGFHGTREGIPLSAIGDSGSWPDAATVEIRSDFDFTTFGGDTEFNRRVRNQCNVDVLQEIAGNDSGLTLQDFDVVVTAEGAEVESGVFETEGGIDWAKRNLKRVTIYNPDGTKRVVELGKGDPVGELAYASMMAKLRTAALTNGDYDRMFDRKGLLLESVFEKPDGNGKALWEKYKPLLERLGVDYFVSRTSTAAGGCLDMAKHLREEVLDPKKKFDSRAKLKKILKYIPRADNIARGAPGVRDLIAEDPILNDPKYSSLLSLARAVEKASPAEIDVILKQRFGDYPDAGLQELGDTATDMILRYSEVAYQAEIDRIVLDEPTPERRRSALEKLAADFDVIEKLGGDYAEYARTAKDTIEKARKADTDGTIEAAKSNREALQKIRKAEAERVKRTREFLQLTELGRKMLERAGKMLDISRVFPRAEGRYKSQAVEFLGEVGESARAQGLTVVQYLGSAAMWASVLNDVRTAKSDADLAVALGKTLVTNTYFGVVYQSLYAFVYQHDNAGFAKAVMYLIVPETALPALVEALGETAITAGSQMLFEAQMDKVYLASGFDKDGKLTDVGGLGTGGVPGAREFVDAMLDGPPEMVAQDFIKKSKATDMGSGANILAIRAVGKAMRATVENGKPLLFTEDGPLMKACEAIRKVNEDIAYCAKEWGATVGPEAQPDGPWAAGFDRGQKAAMNKLILFREKCRDQARQAMAEAIVRTFEERRAAEVSLDEGKAVEEYKRLNQLFEELNIVKEGTAQLEIEGAPFNIFTKWAATTREKQVAAVKAVQKFLKAYEFIAQSRAAVEGSIRNVLGRTLEPRPLTGSLPLTGKPELDVETTRAYVTEFSEVGESSVRDLETLKAGKLEGDEDAAALKQLFEIRAKIAHHSAVMKAARAAQSLHWSVEVFDKQRLYRLHSEAAAEITRLRELEKKLLDAFAERYKLGETSVALTGPAEVKAGEEARLTCTVKVRKRNPDGTMSEPGPVPPDIARQLQYEWKVGGADLGTDARAERTYRLETPGPQTYSVTVKRPSKKGGFDTLGAASWTVTVKKDDDTKPDDKKPDQPPDQPPGGAGKGIFSASASDNWEGGNTKEGFVLTRKPAKIKGPCGWDSGVTASIKAVFEPGGGKDDPKTPDEARVAADKTFKARRQGDTPNDMAVGLFMGGGVEGVNGLSLGEFSGAIADFAIWVRRGSGGMFGYNGSYMGANGRGQAVGPKGGRIVVTYHVNGGGCWDNSDRAYLIRQCEAAQKEAKAIIDSLRLDPNGKLTSSGYKGPKYDGSDLPKVTLVPAQVQKLRVGERVKVQAVVENAEPADAPYTFNWNGDIEGGADKAKSDSIILAPKRPGKYTLSVGVDGKRYGLGGASLDYEVADVRVSIERVPAGDKPVVVGSKQAFKASVTVDGKPGGSLYLFRWQPHPEATFAPYESNSPGTNVVFTKTGVTKVWVEVLENIGGVLTTVGTSPQLDISVVAPKFELKCPTGDVFVGQDVTISLTETPPLTDEVASYWWEATPNAAGGAPKDRDRGYGFRPGDTKPVKIKAHVKAKDGGAELGVAECEVIAKPFAVAVTVTGPEGPKPMVWKEGVGLVPLEKAITTHQNVGLSCALTPTPPNATVLRYEWSLNGDSHFTGNWMTRDIRVYRSQPGTCEATVVVRDGNGVELGRGTGTFEVTVSKEKLEASNKAAEAADKLAKARAAFAKGDIDAAIGLADAAAGLDPKNREASDAATKWRNDKQTIQSHLQTCQQALTAARIPEATAAFDKAKAINALYPPVVEMEKRLKATASSKDTKVKQAIDTMQAANAAKDYQTTLATATKLRRETKLGKADDARVKALETEARNGEAEKERVRQQLRSGEARFNAHDYAGAIADFEVLVGATCFGPNDPEPAKYGAMRTEAVTRLQRINALMPRVKTVAENPKANKNQTSAALKEADEILQLQPENADAQRYRTMLADRLAGKKPVATTPPVTKPPDKPAPPTQPTVRDLATVGNTSTVENRPTKPTRLTFAKPFRLTYLSTYHWNYGKGAKPGSIGLEGPGGLIYGPWSTNGAPGQGGVKNASWECRPEVTLPAGTYTVIDSDPATWARNAGSGGAGFVTARGYDVKGGPFASGRKPDPTMVGKPPTNDTATQTPVKPPTRPPTKPPTKKPDWKDQIGDILKPKPPVVSQPPSNPPSNPTPPPSRPKPPTGGTERDVLNNGNTGGVSNSPTRPTRVTFDRPYVVTYVMTYHWNYGRGARPGTVGLQAANGQMYGPWRMNGLPGQGGVPNAVWECRPNVVVPAGTYTVIDSDPATWAQNAQSGGAGFAIVKGYPVPGATSGGGQPDQPPPSKPKPPSGATTVEAVFQNQSNENVHIFTEGETFGPNNRLTPGETRRVSLRMTPDGRIKFIAGRGGQVLATKVWNGDPSDTSRYPKVIFSGNQLLVTTGLR